MVLWLHLAKSTNFVSAVALQQHAIPMHSEQIQLSLAERVEFSLRRAVARRAHYCERNQFKNERRRLRRSSPWRPSQLCHWLFPVNYFKSTHGLMTVPMWGINNRVCALCIVYDAGRNNNGEMASDLSHPWAQAQRSFFLIHCRVHLDSLQAATLFLFSGPSHSSISRAIAAHPPHCITSRMSLGRGPTFSFTMSGIVRVLRLSFTLN